MVLEIEDVFGINHQDLAIPGGSMQLTLDSIIDNKEFENFEKGNAVYFERTRLAFVFVFDIGNK